MPHEKDLRRGDPRCCGLSCSCSFSLDIGNFFQTAFRSQRLPAAVDKQEHDGDAVCRHVLLSALFHLHLNS